MHELTAAMPAADAPSRSAPADAAPPAGASDSSMELAELFGHAMRRLHRGTREALAPFGLSGSEARVVRLLAGGPMRMTSIAERLSVVPRTVTGIVDGAEAAGVVARRPDPDDRRSTLVELTADGRVLLHRLEAARRDCASSVFEVLTADQRAQLLVLMRALCGPAGCADESPPPAVPAGTGDSR